MHLKARWPIYIRIHKLQSILSWSHTTTPPKLKSLGISWLSLYQLKVSSVNLYYWQKAAVFWYLYSLVHVPIHVCSCESFLRSLKFAKLHATLKLAGTVLMDIRNSLQATWTSQAHFWRTSMNVVFSCDVILLTHRPFMDEMKKFMYSAGSSSEHRQWRTITAIHPFPYRNSC